MHFAALGRGGLGVVTLVVGVCVGAVTLDADLTQSDVGIFIDACIFMCTFAINVLLTFRSDFVAVELRGEAAPIFVAGIRGWMGNSVVDNFWATTHRNVYYLSVSSMTSKHTTKKTI